MSTQHGIDRERGNILLTLLLIMGMSTLVASSLVVASIEWTLAANSVDESSAFLLAESGIEHGLLTLSSLGSELDSDAAGA